MKKQSAAAGRLPLNIILLGDPAAGKATHGQYLAQKYAMYDLDMGRELRHLESDPVLRRRYRLDQTLNQGKLTPTALVRQLLHDKIHDTPKSQGILFNGTPKMLGEARLVAKWLKAERRDRILFIYLSIPLKETIRRMTSRKGYFRGKFSKRPDDNDRALKNRIRYYQTNIKQVVAYFKRLYPYKKISSLGTIVQARRVLLEHLKRYEP
ncbi:MAG TPA: nucleoside monophosphate kinase [Patescibacteria group bacterium]|nr:nucleoside monophosphate kinase [Patescibacteria group bacterium]